MGDRVIHLVRRIAAPLAWLSGIGVAFGVAWLFVLGLLVTSDTACGTVFDPLWRDGASFCHQRMISWITWVLVFVGLTFVFTMVWWFASRRDRIPI